MKRGRLALPLISASVLAIIACGGQPATATPSVAGVSSPTPQDPGPTQSPISSPSPFPSGDEFANVVAALTKGSTESGGELDGLWRWVLNVESGGAEATYSPPTRVVGYRTGTSPDSPCAAGLSASWWAENAGYCQSDGAIYFDEDWLRGFQSAGSNFAPAAIISHEWGHRIQDLLGLQTSVGKDYYPELQADCFAGIFLGQREKMENGTYLLAETDVPVALKTFFDLGDAHYRDSKWLNPQYHGSRLQRIMAFGTGYLGATPEGAPFGRVSNYFPWCYGYQSFEPDAFDSVGPYRLLRPPGRNPTVSASSYTLAAIKGAGRISSAIRLAWLPGILDTHGMDTARDAAFPGLQVLIPSNDLGPMETSAGNIDYVYFEQHDGEAVRSGLYGNFPPQADGTLAIAAYRDEPAISDPSDPRASTLSEEIAALAQIAGRLCVPGASGTPGEANFSAPCSAEQ